MNRLPARTALVVGGGLSGMAAAICLSRLGVRVDLVEIDPSWRPESGPVQIGDAALQALEALGISGPASPGAGIDAMSADGVLLAHYPGQAPTTCGAVMTRPELSRRLADATLAAGAEVRLGTTVKSLRQDPAGVEVEFSDTHGARYDLLVGADGVRSRLRELVLRVAPRPEPSGQGCWSARLPRPPALARATVWQGDEMELALYPLSADAAFLSLRQSGAPATVPAEQVLPMLRGLLARFPAAAVRAVEAGLDGRSQAAYRALERLDLPPPWHSGRAILIGDAVHGTVGRFGVHGSRGMQDAVLLAEEIAAASTIEEALAGCQRRRDDSCGDGRLP